MFENSIVAILKTVLGWRNWFDPAEIPDLGTALTSTLTGEYYQAFSGALRLDYIDATIVEGLPLATYLDEVETDAISNVLNRIVTEKQIGGYGKTIASNDVIYEVGSKVSNITNESRFCGVMFEVSLDTGVRATINRIGLYLTAAVTDLDLYLYHSSQSTSIATFQFTSTSANSFSWNEIRRTLDYDNGTITGGTWYIGYYQDDLATQTAQAVQYNAMNWLHGYCNQCGATSRKYDVQYKSIRSRLLMQGFYVPSAQVPAVGTMFDPAIVIKTNNNNYGFNFNITIGCDLTQFWKDNIRSFKNVIGMAVAMRILEDMKFSSQINNLEESIKIMIVRDLEGAVDTKNPPLNEKLATAIEAINLDMGNVGTDCLPSARQPMMKWGAAGA